MMITSSEDIGTGFYAKIVIIHCSQDYRRIGEGFKQLGAASGGRVDCLEKIGEKKITYDM